MNTQQNPQKAAVQAFTSIAALHPLAKAGRLDEAGMAELAEAEAVFHSLSGRTVLLAFYAWDDGGRATSRKTLATPVSRPDGTEKRASDSRREFVEPRSRHRQ